jgi:hypothetical protein
LIPAASGLYGKNADPLPAAQAAPVNAAAASGPLTDFLVMNPCFSAIRRCALKRPPLPARSEPKKSYKN